MKGKSILLALNGSEQSRFASEVCWELANKLGAKITAQHVIDSHSAWEFLGHEKPGFLDSSNYIESYQSLVSNLFELGGELAEAYAREAKKIGIDDVCLLDEGNPITQILRRAENHKMVVIGHRPLKSNRDPRRHFQRLSIAESLAHDCPCPLLVVQDECKKWTSLSVMISLDHINEVFINSCLDMAAALDLPAGLLCLTGGVHEETPESLVKDLREANERLMHLPIALVPAQKEISVSVEKCYAPDNLPFDKILWENPLIVIPTRTLAGERLTVVDSSPSLFVRHLTLASIMLWPEEYIYSLAPHEMERAKTAELCS